MDSYSPPFGFEKNEEMLEEANRRIKASDADILIVFLGCPKQEKFIYQNKDKYQVPIYHGWLCRFHSWESEAGTALDAEYWTGMVLSFLTRAEENVP